MLYVEDTVELLDPDRPLVHQRAPRKRFGVRRWAENAAGRRLGWVITSWHRTERDQTNAVRAFDGKPWGTGTSGYVWKTERFTAPSS